SHIISLKTYFRKNIGLRLSSFATTPQWTTFEKICEILTSDYCMGIYLGFVAHGYQTTGLPSTEHPRADIS
ncbi:hypothetical protein T265_15695, partial [Opisthorchis viverrini]